MEEQILKIAEGLGISAVAIVAMGTVLKIAMGQRGEFIDALKSNTAASQKVIDASSELKDAAVVLKRANGQLEDLVRQVNGRLAGQQEGKRRRK